MRVNYTETALAAHGKTLASVKTALDRIDKEIKDGSVTGEALIRRAGIIKFIETQNGRVNTLGSHNRSDFVLSQHTAVTKPTIKKALEKIKAVS